MSAENTEAAAGATATLDAATAAKVVKQVSFYFSDSNFRRDRFLRTTAEAGDGWVAIATLASFKRLQTICADAAQVAAALAAADTTAFKLNDDKTMVARTTPLPEEDDSRDRTIYAKGFPADVELEALETYFRELGNAQLVRMRRVPTNRIFKGSVFVEFETKEEAEAVAAREDLSFADTPLVRVCMMRAYLDGKNSERSAKRARKAAEGEEAKSNKRKLDEEGAAGAGADEPAAPAEFEAGQILRVEEVVGEVSREDFKEKFAPHGMVAFVEFARGQTEGFVRMASAPAATGVVESTTDGVADLGEGKTCKVSVLSGDAEQEYWNNVAAARKAKKAHGKNSRRRR